ncbi:unnamed protein product [Brachionus calyciflorus]|uniref:Mothers against decapentaplegic homolog n=1 Tax=Brachionus calyciflorus TaxID=104777 RepID=A0A813X1D9_9BILA|nr:unnamed protein product [Brachionus calyciflorus]
MKPLFTKLAAWKKNDEDEEFVDKAIDALYKKLKVKQGAIEELQKSLNFPNLPSKCVTIARSIDGRLQVSHRKGLPHVIYCRIFRWPDLQSHHELRPISTCEYSFESKQDEVCINPFHYERIDIPILPPVLVPKHVEFAQGQSLIHKYPNTQNYSNYTNTPTKSYDKENINNQYYNFQNNLNTNQVSSPANYSQFNTNINYNYYYYYNNSYSNGSNTSYSTSNTGSPQTNILEESSESFSNLSPNSTSQSNNNSCSMETDSVQSFSERTNWCSIVYYELNSRIGEIFKAYSNDIFVDGYTNPCNSYGRRLCLGMFSNINRNSSIENCRKHIGRGVHVYNDNGDIYVECLSDNPIFIQSRNCNYERGFHPNTVCKLPSGFSLRIFQSKIFAQLLNESIKTGYEAVYDLSNMCVIKLSFVKGWGAEYYRQDVSSCPCWIEIRLNEPFQWLDRVLKEMGSSTNPVSSVS